MICEPELVPLVELKPHPRNYRTHTDDQLVHLCASIREHGLYRNIVTARDLTILAGHGVVLACQRLDLETVPVVRMDIDAEDPRALKLLIGDNQIAHLASIDDRELTEMLKSIHDSEFAELVGTGFDAEQLAALVMVTRPASEIRDHNAAAEWVGMPEYEQAEKPLTVVVHCANENDRDAFLAFVGAGPKNITGSVRTTCSMWWPLRVRRPSEVFEEEADDSAEVSDLHSVEGPDDKPNGAISGS